MAACKGPLKIVAAAGAIQVHDFTAKVESLTLFTLHRIGVDLFERYTASCDHSHFKAVMPVNGQRRPDKQLNELVSDCTRKLV